LSRARLKTCDIAGLALIAAILYLGGCAAYAPPTDPPTDFRQRAETGNDRDVFVSAVILSTEESQQVFAANLVKKGIQAIWIEIDNRANEDLVVNLLAVDRDYFSPSEAAWMSRGFRKRRSKTKIAYFSDQHINPRVPRQSKVDGYVFANFDADAKAFSVQMIGKNSFYLVDFVLPVPGFEADHMQPQQADIKTDQRALDLDMRGLSSYIESLPCCVYGGDLKTPGDPLNLIMVGELEHIISTLVRRGWNLTETVSAQTAWRTAASSVFRFQYKTSPVSPLYVFERSQDAAFQKARKSVDERNHLRLWQAPVTFAGTPVWVGQISRDIGVKASSKTWVTHKIDPMVDEARYYFVMDILESQYLQRVGYLDGVGASTMDAPRKNYTNDEYVTDGRRVVLFLSEDPVPYDELDILDWDYIFEDPEFGGEDLDQDNPSSRSDIDSDRP